MWTIIMMIGFIVVLGVVLSENKSLVAKLKTKVIMKYDMLVEISYINDEEIRNYWIDRYVKDTNEHMGYDSIEYIRAYIRGIAKRREDMRKFEEVINEAGGG